MIRSTSPEIKVPIQVVRLVHPIIVGGERVTHVEASPPTRNEFEEKRAGRITSDQLMALCTGLPLEAGALLSDLDSERLATIIGDLAGEVARRFLDAKRAQFRVIDGGRS